jgi:broad specificity phosphatase PhoE
MSARLTLIAVPSGDDIRSPRFPGRQRLEIALAGLPETVRARLAEAGTIVHAPEIALDADFAAEAATVLAEVDHGAWAGREVAEVAAAEPEAFALWRTDMAFAPPDGESLQDARARANHWLASLGGRSGNILVVTGMIMARLLLTAALEAPLSLIWQLDVTPWSTTELTRFRDRWSLRLG